MHADEKKPAAQPQRSEKYDGPLAILDGLPVLFFHAQSWARRGDGTKGDALSGGVPGERGGTKALYVPVLSITVDKALGAYDYDCFLVSDVMSIKKRLIKVVLAARGRKPNPAEALSDEVKKGHTVHLGTVGSRLNAEASYAVEGDTFFTISYVAGRGWHPRGARHQRSRPYCAVDIAVAMPFNAPHLPLDVFDAGARLPAGVTQPEATTGPSRKSGRRRSGRHAVREV